MNCSRCGIQIRAESGTRGKCEVCGKPLCYRCVLMDRATRCAEHATEQQASGEACCVCGQGGLTDLNSAPCRAVGCEARICNACLSAGEWYCPPHKPQAPEQASEALSPAPAQRVLCAVCGDRVRPSQISRHCASPDCRNAICVACADQGHQHCGEHLPSRPLKQRRPKTAAKPARAPKPTAPAARKCSACGASLPVLWRATCTVEGCERPLCRACRDTAVPMCEAHREQWRRRVRQELQDDSRPSPGAALVTSPRAHLRLLNFFNRLRQRMACQREFELPNGGHVSFAGWPKPTWCEDGDADARLFAAAVQPDLDEGGLSAVPRARSEGYELAPRSWRSLGMRRRRVVIEARAVVRTGRHLAQGGDWEPADLLATLGEVSAAARVAEQCGYFHILCLFSPTGWTEQSRTALAGDEPDERLLFPSLKIALAGPRVDDLLFNRHDNRVSELDELLRVTTDQERVGQLAGRLREALRGRSGMSLSEAAEVLGVRPDEAALVFEALAAEPGHELLTSAAGETLLAVK